MSTEVSTVHESSIVHYESQLESFGYVRGMNMTDPKESVGEGSKRIPPFRYTENGRAVLTLRLSKRIKRGDQITYMDWEITFWGEAAEQVYQLAKPRQMATIYGLMDAPRSWVDGDGNTRIVNRMTGILYFMGNVIKDKSEDEEIPEETEAPDSSNGSGRAAPPPRRPTTEGRTHTPPPPPSKSPPPPRRIK